MAEWTKPLPPTRAVGDADPPVDMNKVTDAIREVRERSDHMEDGIVSAHAELNGRLSEAELKDTFAVPQVSRAVIIGSSLEEQNRQGSDSLDPSIGGACRARGWFHWMNGFLAASGKQLRLLANVGVGGNRWDQMLARFESDVLALGPDIIFLGPPTNDTATRTPSAIIADGEAMIALARSIGARLVVQLIPPRAAFNTLERRATVDAVNSWIADTSLTFSGVTSVDIWTPLADPATGWPVYGATVDGTHYSIAGAARVGKATADAVAPFIAVNRAVPTSGTLDTRRVSDNPAFLDSGAGWVSASGGAVLSYPPADRGFGNKSHFIVTGNTAVSNIRGVTREQAADFIEPGDILQASVRVKWEGLQVLGGNASGVPTLRVQLLDAQGVELVRADGLFYIAGDLVFTWPSSDNTAPAPALPDGEMVLTTWRVTVPTGVAKVRVYLGWISAAEVNAEFSDFAWLKDQAATIDHPSGAPLS